MLDYNVEELTQSQLLSDRVGLETLCANLLKKDQSESYSIYTLEILTNNKIIKKHKINGVEFNVICEGDNIIISHPIWSLSSIGKSLQDAEINILKEAKEVLEHYSKYDPRTMSVEAIKMRDFLLSIS
ncbi:MAG: hypothetical protein COW08_06185 [Ignavibacteriales bacterium CG12_big_fil_rev_8_21_14_0_65_30_8]|nr:MAG: hypothetical protein COW08_06185 [Ignavibacteriales bacterium CG12_big_fil_rev_8_21_14_0_65_30_8]